MTRPDIKVGDTFYVFDINRRIYRDGNMGPDYRGHFRPVTITGETSRSWLYGGNWKPSKIPKKNPWAILYTEEMVEDAVWAKDHAWRIGRAVTNCQDQAKLRQIAGIVGYEWRDAQ